MQATSGSSGARGCHRRRAPTATHAYTPPAALPFRASRAYVRAVHRPTNPGPSPRFGFLFSHASPPAACCAPCSASRKQWARTQKEGFQFSASIGARRGRIHAVCSRSLRPSMSRRGAVGDRGVCVCLLASSDRIQKAQGVTSRRAGLRLRTLTRHPRRARARQVLPPRRARGPIERASPSIRHAGVLGLGR